MKVSPMRAVMIGARAVSMLTVAMVLILWSPAPGRAANDREKFEKLVGKSASVSQNPGGRQTACVCKNGSEDENRAGILVQGRRAIPNGDAISVSCLLLRFDATTGQKNGANFCDVWELLPN